MQKNKWILMLLCILCLTSCGQKEQMGEGHNDVDAQQEIQTNTEDLAYYDIEEVQILDPDLELQTYLSDGDRIVGYDMVLRDGIVTRFATIYDSKNWPTGYFVQELNYPYEEWKTIQIEIPEEKNYSIFQVFYTMDGNIFVYVADTLEKIDYLANLENYKLEVLYTLPKEYEYSVFEQDGNGQKYFYESHTNQVVLWEEESEQIINLSSNILQLIWDPAAETVRCVGMENGNAVFNDIFQKEMVDIDSNGISVYGSVSDMKSAKDIYLANSQSLYNIKDGKVINCLDFAKKAYLLDALYDMELTSEGILVLAMVDGDQCLLMIEESEKPLQEKKEIVLACGYLNVGLQRTIARFNRTNKDYYVSINDVSDFTQLEEYNQRMKIEISNGAGPDIMTDDIVDDVYTYATKGYLQELTDLIDNKSLYLENAFRGVSVGNKLFGVPYDCSLLVTAYSKDFVKEEENWTLSIFMKKVRESEAEIVQRGMNGSQFIIYYCLSDEDNNTYIDWENNRSNLDSPEFIEVLEFAKEYADDKYNSWNDTGKLLESGKAVAITYEIEEPMDMNFLEACFEGNTSLQGLPRKEGQGIYVKTRNLYVNNSSANKEGVYQFIDFILSEQLQKKNAEYEIPLEGVWGSLPKLPINLEAYKYMVSIKRDVKYETQYDNSGVIYRDHDLTDEQVELLNNMYLNAYSGAWKILPIQNMFYEDLEPYFAGDKTAEQVVKILNKRVQLYLDERQ